MNITCDCGKKLHLDECGFHNEAYEDFVIYLCPYCGKCSPSFMPLSLEEIPSIPEELRMPEKLQEKRLEKRGMDLRKKMIEANDSIIEAMERTKKLIEKELTDRNEN